MVSRFSKLGILVWSDSSVSISGKVVVPLKCFFFYRFFFFSFNFDFFLKKKKEKWRRFSGINGSP